MKTLNFENQIENFAEFTLTVEEMIAIKGGDGGGGLGEVTPPIIIKL